MFLHQRHPHHRYPAEYKPGQRLCGSVCVQIKTGGGSEGGHHNHAHERGGNAQTCTKRQSHHHAGNASHPDEVQTDFPPVADEERQKNGCDGTDHELEHEGGQMQLFEDDEPQVEKHTCEQHRDETFAVGFHF